MSDVRRASAVPSCSFIHLRERSDFAATGHSPQRLPDMTMLRWICTDRDPKGSARRRWLTGDATGNRTITRCIIFVFSQVDAPQTLLVAESVFGALRGLETLSQLLERVEPPPTEPPPLRPGAAAQVSPHVQCAAKS